MLRFAKISRTYESKTINSTHRVTKIKRMGLQKLTERRSSLKLKEHISLLGLIGGKGLQTLIGHTGILKFRYTHNKGRS